MDSYNCSGSDASAYGEGNFGTCTSVGAPNTGFFSQFTDGGSFTVIAPLAAAIMIVVIAAAALSIRKKQKQASK